MGEKKLPKCIYDFFNSRGISKSSIHKMEQRIYRVEDIIKQTNDECNESAKLGELIDILELDLGITIGLASNTENSDVSSWVVHSTWTSDFPPNAKLINYLPSDISEALDEGVPSFSCGEKYIKDWLIGRSAVLEYLVKILASSTDYEIAIAAIVAIDAVLTGYYHCLVKLRLEYLS